MLTTSTAALSAASFGRPYATLLDDIPHFVDAHQPITFLIFDRLQENGRVRWVTDQNKITNLIPGNGGPSIPGPGSSIPVR